MAESESDNELAYVAVEDKFVIEKEMENAAFLHGNCIFNATPNTTNAFQATEYDWGKLEFGGLRVDTCCNKTSIMGSPQYHEYCLLFGIRPAIRPAGNRGVKDIGGTEKEIGKVLIDVPFRLLNLIIAIEFLFLPKNCPTLLSMKDMLDNSLDISIQNATVSYGGKTQKLIMDNFFLKQKWGPDDIPHALYTENELRTIHRSSGHPSIKATEGLIGRSRGGNLDDKTIKSIGKIA